MSAERGWLAEPPPQQRDHEPPSHAYKWFKIMGAAKLLPGACKAEKRWAASACEAHMSAERGWIGEPPPQQRDHEPPSHAYKWYKMMGAAKLLSGACKAEESDGRP